MTTKTHVEGEAIIEPCPYLFAPYRGVTLNCSFPKGHGGPHRHLTPSLSTVAQAPQTPAPTGVLCTILGPFGYLSQQPDGTMQSRVIGKTYMGTVFTGPGLYENFMAYLDRVPQPQPQPQPPVIPPDFYTYDVPTNYNPSITIEQFITQGLVMAYGTSDAATVAYWLAHVAEMTARGRELGMIPPERYLWERLLGRGAGGPNVALYGPYAGLVEDQTSRTPVVTA